MKTLQTHRLKPNPAGKDRTRYGGATQAQLGGEWVDVKNTGSSPVNMDGVTLYHVAFANGRASHWEKVIGFTGVLQPGNVVRVHSGSGPVTALNADDLRGADHHIFTQRDSYVWNNAEGDTSRITETQGSSEVETDKVGYAPNPPEGVVLVRAGDQLIPGRIAA